MSRIKKIRAEEPEINTQKHIKITVLEQKNKYDTRKRQYTKTETKGDY